MPHEKLLHKLECLAPPLNIIKCISAYTFDRGENVLDHSSELLHVTSGVPQGSVLEPLLLLIYVNDVVDLIHGGVSIPGTCRPSLWSLDMPRVRKSIRLA